MRHAVSELKKIKLTCVSRWFLWLGLLLRTIQYLYNKSVWHDEAVAAVQLSVHPFSKLQYPLPSSGGAYLYMLLQKSMLAVFGMNELALRFFPYFFSCASVIVFYLFMKRQGSAMLTALTVFMFSTSDNLIYYAAEFRQYSFDVFVAVAILYGFSVLSTQPIPSRRVWLGLGFGGASLIWLSHISVIVLFCCGCVYLLGVITGPSDVSLKRMLSFVSMTAVWMLSFVSHYFFSIIHWLQSPLTGSFAYYRGLYQYLYFPMHSVSEFLFNIAQLFRLLCFFIGLRLTPFKLVLSDFFPVQMDVLYQAVQTHWISVAYIVLLCALTGGMLVFGSRVLLRENRYLWGVTLLPVLLMMGLSGFEKYPFLGRHLLFLFPFLIVMVSTAFLELYRLRKKVGVVALVFFMIQPTFAAAYHVVEPRCLLTIRPALERIASQFGPSDKIILFGNREVLTFYEERFGFSEATVLRSRSHHDVPEWETGFWVVSINDPAVDAYVAGLKQVKGYQVWEMDYPEDAAVWLYYFGKGEGER